MSTEQNTLLKYRAILLSTDISPESMDLLHETVLDLQLADPREPIRLLISSGGGSTRAALTMCDLIRHVYTVPIHAVAIGHCHSAATFILASCPVRKCTPNTTFIIHSNTSEASFRVDEMLEERMQDFLRETKMLAQMVVAHYVRTLGITPERAQELIKRGDKEFDTELNAEDALKLGLVTEVVDGKLDIFPAA